jgi:hypothetical protein
MTKKEIWKLFIKTGKIRYYLKYKAMANEGE